MKFKNNILNKVLAVVVFILLLAYIYSCAACRKTNKQAESDKNTDSVDTLLPTHPPVVIPYSWKEEMNRK